MDMGCCYSERSIVEEGLDGHGLLCNSDFHALCVRQTTGVASG